jgi:F420-dependent oxidoreductase-like protein
MATGDCEAIRSVPIVLLGGIEQLAIYHCRMRLSPALTNFSWSGGPTEITAQLLAVARAADDSALDTLWVSDHLLQADPATPLRDPMMEAYTTLGYLAACTSRIQLGTMVTAATFRSPALLVKAVTTVDVLSGGRAWLGIGAGHNREEAAAMGLAFGSVAHRFEAMIDTLRIAQRMWDGDESEYHGLSTYLGGPICNPMPIRRPRILIGGSGERRTLRLVAEYADACNLFDIPDGGVTIRRQLDVLARHCAEVGRDYDTIETTLTTALEDGEAPRKFIERCAEIADLGVDHVVVITRGRPWEMADIETLAIAAGELAPL